MPGLIIGPGLSLGTGLGGPTTGLSGGAGLITGTGPGSLSSSLWLDPSDSSTLFQDTAGTIPATANDDPVGRINDKSGNGRNALQVGAAGTRPLLKVSGALRWLEFDGTDDFLRVAFAMSQPWERVSGIRQITWTINQRIYGPGAGAGDSFLFQNGVTPTLSLHDGLSGCDNTGAAVDADAVATERHNGAGSRLAIDNVAYTTNDTGAASSTGLTLASDGTPADFGNFRCYGLVMVPRLLTDAEIAMLRTYYAAKQGRVL